MTTVSVEDFFEQAATQKAELTAAKNEAKDLRKRVQTLETERDGLAGRVAELSGELEVLRVKALSVEAVENKSAAVEQQLRILETQIEQNQPLVAIVETLAAEVLKLANKGR